jgi:hypothetical protein
MNVMPVAAFLKDFSEYPPEPARLSPEEESEERSLLVEAARAEGFQAGREDALAEAEARIAEREAEFQQKLVAAREAWSASEAAVLATSIAQGLDQVRDELIAVTARVLMPFLTEEVRKRALSELAVTIKDVLAREPGSGIVVTGPPDLLKNLELQLSEYAGAMTFTPSQSCEVEVKAGHALLSTRISAWVDKINEAGP